MKKLIFILVILFLALGIARAASTGLAVDISKYEPYPAQPGDYLDVWISAQNIGTDPLTDAQLKIAPVYPFSLDPNQNSTIVIGTIPGGQAVVSKVRIRVDQNAVQGDNFLDVQYRYNGFDWLTKRINVFVQTHDAILAVKKISTVPDTLVPGDTGNLFFEIENMADSFLRDVKIKLDLTNESLPFIVVNSSSEKWIYSIDSGKTETVSFSILTFPDAESKVYKVPFELSYYDSLGTKYSKEDTFGIVVGNVPFIEVLLDKTSIRQSGTAGTVTFEIINKGLTGIKFLTVEIAKTDDFEVISPNKIYMGELASDDTDSFDMTFFIKSTSKSAVEIPVKLQYLDSSNNEYNTTENVSLRLYTGSEISAYNLQGGDMTVTIAIVLLIIAVAGWFVYTKWFKKR